MDNVSAKLKQQSDLRRRAEETLREKPEHLKELTIQDIQGIIHELRVHQIELEMQNEDLRRTQKELEESRKEYTDLYDFAPIGYFTFDKDGLILKVNLTGARKLGEERRSLIRQPFLLYVVPEDRMLFYSNLHQALRTGTMQTYELKLMDKKKHQFYTQLESMPVQDTEGKFNQCWTAVIDITERKQSEELSKALYDINLTINSTLDFDEIMRKVVVEAAKAIGSDACNITLCSNDH